jgi:proliferating cell nuclear antigen
MFNAKVKMEVLRELVEVVSTLVTETKLQITKEGIEVKAVDPSHVAMLVLSLKKASFEEFSGEPTEIGVDVEKFKDVLKLSKPGDILELNYDSAKKRLVVSVGKITRSMGVVDPGGITDPKVPNVNPPGKVVLKIDELRQGIRGSESISDHVTIALEPDYFIMHSEGESDRLDLRIPRSELAELDVKDAVRSMYPLDFFSSMVKSISSAEEVTMYVGNEYPLKLQFTMAQGHGDGRFLLAPRVEED